MIPYQAKVKHTGGGFKSRGGMMIREYTLRLYGGRMKAQTYDRHQAEPFILRKAYDDGVNYYGPRWLAKLEDEINALATTDPYKLLELLDNYKTMPTDPTDKKGKVMAIVKPTYEQLTDGDYTESADT